MTFPVVVDDLDILRVTAGPDEAHAPPAVHADAVLAFAIAAQSVETVVRLHPQVLERRRPIEHGELPHGDRPDALEAAAAVSLERSSRVRATERQGSPCADTIAAR
jgi:hypothetical protein